MAVPLESVVKQLTDSGIIAAGKLENFVPPKATPKDGEELLRELHRQNLLTKFQAQQVAAGRTKSLVLGAYTILDRIGAGGMGQVFKAEHRRMKRLVAIKTLPANTMKDAAAIARFQREVEAAAKLRHTNIVAADDAAEANGVHFLVMEYVEGQDLSVLVKKNGPLPVEKAVNYVLQVARGLEFAHGEGVVHRDIKPANLLLDKKGTVKILDMGLARFSADGNANTQAELTGTGAVMGTVDYMAPEQARNTKDADARADIYSLGCSLFYLLTARPLYTSDTLTNKLIAHQFDPIPSFQEVRDGVPEEFETVFRRMVAKKVEDRYQTMSEVIADLQACGLDDTATGTLKKSTSATDSNSNLSFLRAATVQTSQRKTKAIPAVKVVGGGAKNKKVVLIAAAVLGVLLLAGIIVSLRTKEGTLIVEVDQPDATVQVLDAEGKVEVSQKGGVGKVTIGVDPGRHRLKVEKEGFAVFGQEFEMEKGGKTAITARLEAVPASSSEFALDFDGIGSCVTTPIRYTGAYPVTIEARVKLRSTKSTRQVVVVNSNTSKAGIFLLSTGNNWHFQSNASIQPSAGRIEDKTVHLAGVFDLTSILFYVDGILQGSKSAQYMNSTFPLTIGSSGVSNYFDGTIDEVRISKVARYTGNFKPEPRFTPDADTIALYHFDEGSGATAFDSSENKHHAKIVGAKWVRADGSVNANSVVSSPTAQTIPSEALAFGGHRYLLVNGAVTWRAAKAKAEALGGHLATITTNEENDWIKSTILASLPDEKLTWIGGDKKMESRSDFTWTWITSEPWGFTDWGPVHREIPVQSRAGIIRTTAYGLVWGSWGRDAIPTDPKGQDRVHGYLVEWDEPTKATTPTASVRTPTPPLAKAPFNATQAKAHQEAWAKHLGIEVETTNSVGMKMILIPPGEFLMGSTDEQIDAALKVAGEIRADQLSKDRIEKSERPQHKVTITKPFLMSATEATVGQFKKFAASTGYQTEAEKVAESKTYLSPGYTVTDDLPAAFITWNDAVAYCKWIGEQESTSYRLPTEAEWEYACRAGTTTQYSFGDDVALADQYGWYTKNASGKSHPVGTKLPNGFGLFDMHGNLYEWCGDYFDEKWYSTSTPNNPDGPPVGSDRVFRGGSCSSFPTSCRSAHRRTSLPSYRNYVGIRCVTMLDVPVTTASVTPQPTVSVAAPATSITDFNSPQFQAWMKEVQAMPATEQIKAVSKKLVELNPGFDGVVDRVNSPLNNIENGVVTSFAVFSNAITDISPVKALTGLKQLHCGGTNNAIGGKLSDLSALQGLPLTNLSISHTKISDLSPLAGMTLVTLRCNSTLVFDLSPLTGMPLTSLHCQTTPVSDLTPLVGCKSLQSLNVVGTKVTAANVAALQQSIPNCKIEWVDPAKPTTLQPAASSKLFMHDPAFPQWMKDVQAMTAEEQVKAVSKKLIELNPRFDGKVGGANGNGIPTVENGAVTLIGFVTGNITDISPVRALRGLKQLHCMGSTGRKGILHDLSPLEGMNLTDLVCYYTQVEDLSPLKDMPLTLVGCDKTQVSDLSPLASCKALNFLGIKETQVSPAAVAALQKALPNCKITWDDPAKKPTPQPAASGTK